MHKRFQSLSHLHKFNTPCHLSPLYSESYLGQNSLFILGEELLLVYSKWKLFLLHTRRGRNELISKTLSAEFDDESDSGEMYTEPRRPMNIASKMGMDAFKLFLIDTPGEKLFLLWIEIEKLKSCESIEKRKRSEFSSRLCYVPMNLLSLA